MQDSSSSKRRKAPALHDAPSEAQLAAGPAAAPNQQQQCQPHPTAVFQMPAGLPREPSPGAMHGCRIAAWSVPAPSADGHSTVGAALASGAHVYWSQLRVPAALRELRPEQQGKEGVVLPLRLQAPAVQQLQQLPARAGEVQALALLPCGGDAQQPGQVLLATVDAFGSGSICRVSPCWEYAGGSSTAAAAADGDGAADGDAAAAAAAVAAPLSPPTVEVQAPLQPMGPCREGGWAGVCFSGGSGSTSTSSPLLLATARSFAKDVTLHDASTGQGLRCFNCLLHPYALSFLPSTVCAAGGGGSSSGGAHVLAVAEGHMVSIWDARVGGAGGGCVQRLVAGTQSQPLYTLAWCHAEVRSSDRAAALATRCAFACVCRRAACCRPPRKVCCCAPPPWRVFLRPHRLCCTHTRARARAGRAAGLRWRGALPLPRRATQVARAQQVDGRRAPGHPQPGLPGQRPALRCARGPGP
jgi:hypothetical protein